MHKHRIILENFDLEEGKISFFKLKELQDKLAALAEGVVFNPNYSRIKIKLYYKILVIFGLRKIVNSLYLSNDIAATKFDRALR